MRTLVRSVGTVPFLLLVPQVAAAVVLTVSNAGVDSPTCGPSASPCRSITRAVQNAAAGDRVVVRPGIYSDDLDNDGVFAEPGDEPGVISIGLDSLTVESTGGAAATLIRRRGTILSSSGVSISGNNAKFGKLNKGFTVITQGGVNATGISATGTGTQVVGNVVAGTVNIGIGATATDVLLKDNRVACQGSGGNVGFFVLLGQGIELERNTAIGCASGFAVAGPGHVLTRNLAIGSGVGFTLGEFAEFTRNGAIGSTGAGLTLNSSPSPTGLILANSFLGNGTAFGLNCGIQNNTGTSVTAAGNFWGATTGPGSDPADQVCNGFGSTTVTSPFATTDFTPTMAALR